MDEATSSSISGGDFSGNAAYGVISESSLTVLAGTFQDNGFDGLVTYSTVSLDGGIFGGNSRADLTTADTGSIKIYGYFAGLSNGQTETLPQNSGSFTGTLEDDTTPETFKYLNTRSMTLYEVPQPTSLATISLLALALLAPRIRKASRRSGS